MKITFLGKEYECHKNTRIWYSYTSSEFTKNKYTDSFISNDSCLNFTIVNGNQDRYNDGIYLDPKYNYYDLNIYLYDFHIFYISLDKYKYESFGIVYLQETLDGIFEDLLKNIQIALTDLDKDHESYSDSCKILKEFENYFIFL